VHSGPKERCVIAEEVFRSVLGRFASGVTVVTAMSDRGDCGMTVSAFCSLSLSPPLVLFCIDHAARMHTILGSASHFAVNILEESQEPIARRFSDPDIDRLDGVGFRRGITGAPVLSDVLATLECRKQQTFPGGDHTVFTGEVAAAEMGEGKPLLYFRGGYTQLCP
jgi:flavin reductase (DIM6/NTAB) family NADH-FMN oxidoreductase RutF